MVQSTKDEINMNLQNCMVYRWQVLKYQIFSVTNDRNETLSLKNIACRDRLIFYICFHPMPSSDDFFNFTRDVFYVCIVVDLMKTVKLNAYNRYIFGKI